jgi:hypothetical protein
MGLTTAQKVARVEKCKQQLALHARDDVIISVNKLFLYERDPIAVFQFQNVSQMMVKACTLLLLFMDSYVKANQDY